MHIYPGSSPLPPATAGSNRARLLQFRSDAADRARATYLPDTAWPVSGHPPGSARSPGHPGFDVICFSYDTSAVVHSRSPSRSPPDAITGAFSPSLTTTVFSQRGMRRFEASLRRATPKGRNLHHPSSIAPDALSYMSTPSRSGHTAWGNAQARIAVLHADGRGLAFHARWRQPRSHRGAKVQIPNLHRARADQIRSWRIAGHGGPRRRLAHRAPGGWYRRY